MPWTPFFFSFQGRIGRREFWLRFILPMLLIWTAAVALLPIEALVRMIPLAEAQENPMSILTPLTFLMMVATVSTAIPVGVKRLHDRDRGGWFLILYLVPIMGVIVLVELGFFRGTRGPNKFGPDPLARTSALSA